MAQIIGREALSAPTPNPLPANQSASCLSPSQLSSSHLSALIAAGESATRLLLRVAVQKEGFQVIEARSGHECLACFQEHQPDIVLLDAAMPAQDGLSCCTALRRLAGCDRLPVLMIISIDDALSIQRVFAAGATDYVVKPIHWVLIRQRMRSLKAVIQQQRAKRKMEISQKEKESLLQEIHYRIRNNLKTMSSLLHLQAKEMDAVMLSYCFILSELVQWH
ncbi:MAG: response regulator [Phormidesmis sp.]